MPNVKYRELGKQTGKYISLKYKCEKANFHDITVDKSNGQISNTSYGHES